MTCGSVNLAHESKLTLSCGGFSKLGKLRRVGLIKNNEENCNSITFDERTMRGSLSREFSHSGGSLFENP